MASHRAVLGANGVFALVAALVLIGCGSSTSNSRSTSTAGSGAPKPAPTTVLTRFLVRSGEEPGFTPRSPQISRSANAWVTGEPSAQRTADIQRYNAEGFVAAALEHTTPSGGGDGISTVVKFATSTGARHEMTYLLHAVGGAPGATTFTVAGIPTARGVKAQNPGETDTNLVWVQGHCTLLIGESIPKSTAATGPLSAAAKAVYRRTGGTCP
jgi:hypothetical protein